MGENQQSEDWNERVGVKAGALEPSSSHGINPRDRGFDPIDPAEEFGNTNPVVLEIGSGKGRFLVGEALENPDRNYVGIEMALQYYRIVRQRVEKRDLPNARVINYDAKEVISRMFPDRSVDEVHIYFPDPWPKKRQKKRRFVEDAALEQLVRIMKKDATGLFVTDHCGYFDDSVPVFERWFRVEAGEVTNVEPRTNYEAKYREEGRRIYEIRFRKLEE